MKIICINNKNYEEELTIYKTYEFNDKLFNVNDNNFWRYIILINDKGSMNFYPKILFKSLDEYRNDKINKLLGNESSLYK
jgi:hypothetical protein